MTQKEFKDLIMAKNKEFKDVIHRRLPVLVGRKATDFFKNNFRQGGFVNNGLHPWQKTQRQGGGKSAASQYGPLMSGRKNLYGSIRYVPGDAQVMVGTTLHYAAIHNWGGTVTSHPTVTRKMRKFAWAKFFAAGGNKGGDNQEASKWKALALTKKQKLDITSHIPQRQFLGPSKELNDMIQQTIENEITNILKL